jgi:hypothetical protein
MTIGKLASLHFKKPQKMQPIGFEPMTFMSQKSSLTNSAVGNLLIITHANIYIHQNI